MQRIANCFGCNRVEPDVIKGTAGRNQITTVPAATRSTNFFSGLRSPRRREGPSDQEISESKFSVMPAAEKIRWLRRAAPSLPAGQDPSTDLIIVGPRVMTRKEALCLALDLAIESERRHVPALARQLVNEYQADDLNFVVLGVPFSRDRIGNWARDGLPPGQPPPPPPRLVDLGKALYRNNSQNVHDAKVVAALKKQLVMIEERVLPTNRISQTAAEGEIHACLGNTGYTTAAHNGLQYVVNRSENIHDFGSSARNCLCVLWNYIRSVPDPVLRKNLQASMAAKLTEIAQEQPCAVGTITRIIDISTAIDWSLTHELSVEQLRQELQALAGAINESCSADRDLQAQGIVLGNQARSTNGRSELLPSPDIETEMSDLIRDQFLHAADIEFGMLRCIDRQVIKMEAEQIFPKGVVV